MGGWGVDSLNNNCTDNRDNNDVNNRGSNNSRSEIVIIKTWML